MSHFHRGAKVGADAPEDEGYPAIDSSMVDSFVLVQNLGKTHPGDADYLVRGAFLGVPFKGKVHSLTARDGRRILRGRIVRARERLT
jgi:hypothetical protein